MACCGAYRRGGGRADGGVVEQAELLQHGQTQHGLEDRTRRRVVERVVAAGDRGGVSTKFSGDMVVWASLPFGDMLDS